MKKVIPAGICKQIIEYRKSHTTALTATRFGVTVAIVRKLYKPKNRGRAKQY